MAILSSPALLFSSGALGQKAKEPPGISIASGKTTNKILYTVYVGVYIVLYICTIPSRGHAIEFHVDYPTCTFVVGSILK